MISWYFSVRFYSVTSSYILAKPRISTYFQEISTLYIVCSHTHISFHRRQFLEISLATVLELEARRNWDTLTQSKIYDMRLSWQNPRSLKDSGLVCNAPSIQQTSKTLSEYKENSPTSQSFSLLHFLIKLALLFPFLTGIVIRKGPYDKRKAQEPY